MYNVPAQIFNGLDALIVYNYVYVVAEIWIMTILSSLRTT